jgi:hypothetical protein
MSQRTIEPGLAFFSACDVRVALMPVGPVPKEALDAYARALHERRHVSPWISGGARARAVGPVIET